MVKEISNEIDFDFEIEELDDSTDWDIDFDDSEDDDGYDWFYDEDEDEDEDDDLVVFGRLDELDWEIDLLDDEV